MRGRFAPSPTGDLHLGGARTALVAWLSARAAQSTFLVRMEDLDRPRVVPGAEARILEDLEWLGLDWDEPVVRQSERIDLYEAALAKLDTFPCYCSRAEVARAALAPHGPDYDGPRYPGTCRELKTPPAGRKPSTRLRVPDGEIAWRDRFQGERCDNPSQQVGDFVVRRADGIFAYQLAVVVDDLEQRIEEVVRGADLISSTARQIFLFGQLGAAPPAFAHVPLVLGPDGQRLSKRHGTIAVRELGLSPRALVGRLAATLNLGAPGEELSPKDLLPRFSDEKLPRSATTLNQ